MEPEFPGLQPDHPLRHVYDRVEQSLENQGRVRIWRRRAVQGLMVAAAATVGLVLWKGMPAPEPLAASPLQRQGGAFVVAAEMLPAGSEVVFTEGSRIELGNQARLAVEENAAGHFRTRLEAGRIVLNVQPTEGDPRRHWSIRAGAVTVEVVGTRFSVDRSLGKVRVSVQRGRVRVHGSTVPGGETFLDAGGGLTVPATSVVAESANRTASTEEPPPLNTNLQPTETEETADPAVATPEREPSEPEVLRRSDALRRRGEHRAAAALLRQALADSAGGREAALLAFTLGRIQLDNLGQPRPAARSFAAAIRAGLPSALQEQALARSVQAWSMAGDHTRATALARRYLEAYPQGPNRDLVLRRLER